MEWRLLGGGETVAIRRGQVGPGEEQKPVQPEIQQVSEATKTVSWPVLCAQTSLVFLRLFIKTPVLLDQGPMLGTSFNLNYPLPGPSSKDTHPAG